MARYGGLLAFQPIPEDKKIVTESFLANCRDLITIFDDFGRAFYVVKSDILGNINKLTKKFEQNKEKYHTLQDIVRSEIAEKTTRIKNSATDALLWLKRALNFIAIMLEELVKTKDEVSACASRAYDQTLRNYHGFIVRGVFSVAVKAAPYRQKFIKALGKGKNEEETIQELKKYTNLLLENVNVLNQFYKETGEEKSDKV